MQTEIFLALVVQSTRGREISGTYLGTCLFSAVLPCQTPWVPW